MSLARPLHPLALSVAMAFAAVLLLNTPSVCAAESVSTVRGFSIPAGDLSQALNSLAEQSGLVLAFDAGLTRGKHSNGLNGQYDTDVALSQLLAGSGLQALKLSADRYRLEAIPDNGAAMELQATTISGAYQSESPTGPVAGYVATRSLSGTKTDTPIIETPQSISIVTKDQMRAQNAESLNQILRYSAAVVPETRGATASRLDQLTIRGFSPATYLGVLRAHLVFGDDGNRLRGFDQRGIGLGARQTARGHIAGHRPGRAFGLVRAADGGGLELHGTAVVRDGFWRTGRKSPEGPCWSQSAGFAQRRRRHNS